MIGVPRDIDVVLVAPRYLAGPGDPAWVTVPPPPHL